jgi:hypothetical protein
VLRLGGLEADERDRLRLLGHQQPLVLDGGVVLGDRYPVQAGKVPRLPGAEGGHPHPGPDQVTVGRGLAVELGRPLEADEQGGVSAADGGLDLPGRGQHVAGVVQEPCAGQRPAAQLPLGALEQVEHARPPARLAVAVTQTVPVHAHPPRSPCRTRHDGAEQRPGANPRDRVDGLGQYAPSPEAGEWSEIS